MVPDLQKEAPVQVKPGTEAVQYQPAGALPVAAKTGAGKRERSIVFAYDGASPGNSSRHGVTNHV